MSAMIDLQQLILGTSDYISKGIPGIRGGLKTHVRNTVDWPRSKSSDMKSSEVRKMLTKIMTELRIEATSLQPRILTAIYGNSSSFEAGGLEAYYYNNTKQNNLFISDSDAKEDDSRDTAIYFYYKYLESKNIKITNKTDLAGVCVFLHMVLTGLRYGSSGSGASEFSYFGGGEDCFTTKKKMLAKIIKDDAKAKVTVEVPSIEVQTEQKNIETLESEETVDSWEDLL